MTSRLYQLWGFANGGASTPSFLLPVFSNGKSLFVQRSVRRKNIISSFANFSDETEIIENKSLEYFTIGDPKIFAVQERGGRLVHGERTFVSKYLEQNLDNYIETPYFLNDAIEFTGASFPLFNFVDSSSALQETNAFVNSFSRFCQLRKIDILPRKERDLLDPAKYKPESKTMPLGKSHLLDISQLEKYQAKIGNQKNVFYHWTRFAEDDCPRLLSNSIWANIEKFGRSCIDSDLESFAFSSVRFLVVVDELFKSTKFAKPPKKTKRQKAVSLEFGDEHFDALKEQLNLRILLTQRRSHNIDLKHANNKAKYSETVDRVAQCINSGSVTVRQMAQVAFVVRLIIGQIKGNTEIELSEDFFRVFDQIHDDENYLN